MKRVVPALLFLALAVPGNAVDGAPPAMRTIDGSAFEGFERCDIGGRLRKTVEALHADPGRSVVGPSVWSYRVKSSFRGLPVEEVRIGVCLDNSRGCGWGNYVALVMPVSVDEASGTLATAFGADFRKELRGDEAGETLRPVLAPAGDRTSILYCDPGIL